MDYYAFNRPRRDGWLSWPCWLTDSGRFTHKVVTRPAISLAQDRESSPARTGGLTTVLRHQLHTMILLRFPAVRRMSYFRSTVECESNLTSRGSPTAIALMKEYVDSELMVFCRWGCDDVGRGRRDAEETAAADATKRNSAVRGEWWVWAWLQSAYTPSFNRNNRRSYSITMQYTYTLYTHATLNTGTHCLKKGAFWTYVLV